MKKILIALLATPLIACAHGPDYRGNDAAAFIGGAIVGAVISANRPVYVQPPVYQQQPVYIPPVVIPAPAYNPTPNVYYQQVPSPYGGAPCSYVHQPYRAPTLICQ